MRRLPWNVVLAFAPAICLFVIGALTDIGLPGVYMDAVNPDYIVVRLLNPAAIHMPIWAPPGSVLFGRFPTFGGSIYYGALPYYIGLPSYILFGTGVVGIRIANMTFGLVVLAAVATFMRAFRIRPLISGLCLALLALDPQFLFSFRTQFDSTTLPIAALLWSIALVETYRERPTRYAALGAGFLAGFSCYAYFIYGFFVPAAALFALWRWHPKANFKQLVIWAGAGFLFGVLPNLAGFVLTTISLGSIRTLIETTRRYANELQVLSSTLSPLARIKYLAFLLTGTTSDVGPTTMMLGEALKPVLSGSKTIVLFVLPLLALLVRPGRTRMTAALAVLAGILAGFSVLVLAFGDRLWLHHAAPMLPLLYAALALSLEHLAAVLMPLWRRAAAIAAILITGPFLVANAVARQVVFLQLEATGGVGYSSDAITRYAQDSLKPPNNTIYFFPDWGVYMPFAMITGGNLPYYLDFVPRTARALLCQGHNVEVALIASKPLTPSQTLTRLPEWEKMLGWSPPIITDYKQRDGKLVLRAARWLTTDRLPEACKD